MTDGEAQALMKRHGITAGHRPVYHYQGYVYGNLMDAVNYAELVAERRTTSLPVKPGSTGRARRR